MNKHKKEELIIQWKMLRGKYFNLFQEDTVKFKKRCSHHPLYKSVVENLDKKFTEVNQIAELEIDIYLQKK